MEHTSNYNLSQWAGEDRILREDFNADNAKIEAALQAATETALAEHVTIGSYVGDDTKGRVITLPFTPKAVILLGYINSNSALSVITANANHFVASGGCGSGELRIVENGIKLNRSFNWHNESGKTEYYIAFR